MNIPLDIIKDFGRLSTTTAQTLLWWMFKLDQAKAVKIWLYLEFDISQMELAMLFFGHALALIPDYFVFDRLYQVYPTTEIEFRNVLQTAFDYVLFLPEIASHLRTSEELADCHLLKPEFLNAMKIIRSRWDSDRFRQTLARASFDKVSLDQRTHAAIISDDDQWLRRIATEPSFAFLPEHMEMAAHYGSLKCFRFLSINNCAYTPNVLYASLRGGNTEIVQMCIENGLDLGMYSHSLQFALSGGQPNVIEWLLDVHELQPDVNTLLSALVHMNYSFFIRFVDKLRAPWSLNQLRHHRNRNDVGRLLELIQSDDGIFQAVGSPSSMDLSQILEGPDDAQMKGVFHELQRGIGHPGVQAAGTVKITGSVSDPSQLTFITVEGQPFFSDDAPGQWIMFDFLKKRVSLTGYALQFFFRGQPRSWEVSGSADGSEWIVLDTQPDFNKIGPMPEWISFPISQPPRPYKYIKLVQTGPNHSGNHCLSFFEMELVGEITQAPTSHHQ